MTLLRLRTFMVIRQDNDVNGDGIIISCVHSISRTSNSPRSPGLCDVRIMYVIRCMTLPIAILY